MKSRPMTTVAFLGDLMLGRGVNDELRYRSPESLWGTTLPLLRATDAVIANLECAITSHTAPWPHTRKVFHFRADPSAVEVLRAANVRAVSLANNHTLDFDERGLLDTLLHLDAAHIAHAGAGRNRAAAAAPAFIRLPKLTIGMVAMTDNEPAFAAAVHGPGTFFEDLQSPSFALLPRLAASCRDGGADLAVLSLHWGPNMAVQPPPRFRQFARAAVDAGFDIVHGHSAHVFQGVETYRGRPIFYDCGDFIGDYLADQELRNDWSFIFLVDATKRAIDRVHLVPVRLSYARVDLAAGEEADAICRTMVERSAAIGSPVTPKDGTIQIVCRSPGASGVLKSSRGASAARVF